eukprot:Hpha_TRINITY_DN8294_c0_g1::TRINITY_DN8294_c0_g1_i1::g.111927::m.111927/K12381/ARSG; arylsulfatase G
MALLAAVAAVAGVSRPNFVILFVDDSGYADYGFNDPSVADTPHFDALAARGMRFTDWHSAASVCTPSRAGLLTGRFGLRTGTVSNFGPFSKAGLPLNETILSELLHGAGYATGMAGKWHLGHHGEHHPSRRGFERFTGTPMSHDYGCTDTPGNNIDCPQCSTPYGPCNDRCSSVDADGPQCHIGPNNPWNESIPVYLNETIWQQPANLSALSEHYASFAADFIRDAAAAGRPFFLYVATNHMHVPIAYNERWARLSKRGPYGDATRELDHMVGNISDAVEQAGVWENTLLFMTTDNGAPDDQCEFGGSNGPYQGEWMKRNGGGQTGKTSTWEGGHRLPAIFVWPGRIVGGSTSSVLAGNVDIFPTLAGLAGVDLPPHRVYDGLPLDEILFNGGETHHVNLVHPNSGSEGKIGEIDTVRVGRYKAKWRTGGGSGCIKTGGGKSTDVLHKDPFIFDLVADPGESSPLDMASKEWQEANKSAVSVRHAFLASVAADNTTHTDYSSDHSVRPCCNPSDRLCRC